MMRPTRRKLLTATGAALTGAVAGCSSGDEESTPTGTGTPAGGQPQGGTGTMTASVETAVAAEWNAMRARIRDAHAAGLAGATGAGAAVAQSTFARFENASGEYGAHEMLEATSEESYEGFEEALGALRTDGLEAGDMDRAGEAAATASSQLAEAQQSLVSEAAAELFELQLLGATAQNAGFLAASGNLDAAGTVASNVASRFESASVHDSLESVEGDAYERFESALDAAGSAAESGDAARVRSAADDAFTAAIDGSYVLGNETVAGTGHMAALQARGWDAAALASMGGPSTDYAHAASLTIYRARAYDCHWLAARGETDRAAAMAGDIFAHFEGANAHEALEGADETAYEEFETGLSDLRTAIENGNSSAVDSAVETVDSSLVTGTEALAGDAAPLLEAAFFRARFADAYELYQLGENAVAKTVAESLFQRFERNELDIHETVEETSEQLYTSFEEDHLAGLIDGFGNANDSEVETHYEGVNSTLLSFETEAGTTATVSGAEGAYMAARGFDAAAVDALGADSRAQAIAQGAFQHFEGGAGGFHEALEDADESVYESFESELGAVGTAAGNGSDVYPAAKSFNAEALAAVYAVINGAGGSQGGTATAVMQDVFAHFEGARVHELIEEADHNAYETFEGGLDAYIAALEDGGDVEAAADTFADGAQYAGFALVDSVESLPLDLDLAGGAGGSGESGGSSGESDLAGGPNVAEGSPNDADHVVDMNAVAFEPADLTVSQGDTVAWVHSAGEPHSVTAYGEEIPDGATYWASGGFDSEDAARSGWENGEGAVQSGQYYTHTFETTGTHQYFCIPHEAAGMKGSVTVE